jgi:hypothetical protein
MALLAETPQKLQSDSLKNYCDMSGLRVNTEKTKVMVFKKIGSLKVLVMVVVLVVFTLDHGSKPH